MQYGRDDLEWHELVRCGTQRLIDVARSGSTTTYSELNTWLVEDTGGPVFDFTSPGDRSAMGHLLGRIVEENRGESGLMLSALVHYLGGTDPGPGFFKLAENLGLLAAGATPSAKDAFWIAQLNGLYAFYSR